MSFRLLSLPFASLLLLTACSGVAPAQVEPAPVAPPPVASRWINQSALDTLRQTGSPRQALASQPAAELLLQPDGRAERGDGERWTPVRWQRDGERLLLDQQAWPLAGGQLMSPGGARFVPAGDVAAGTDGAFRAAANAAMFPGRWEVLTARGRGTGQIVTFHPDGSLQGTNKFRHYRLCLAGDCLAQTRGDSLRLDDGGTPTTLLLSRDRGQYVFRQVRAGASAGALLLPGVVYMRLRAVH